MLHKMALSAYLCLNTVHSVPKLWDPTAGKTEQSDYRHTEFYQRMLRGCTAPDGMSDVATYPHRLFFGISADRFHDDEEYGGPKLADSTHWLQHLSVFKSSNITPGGYYGFVPFEEFLTLENPSVKYMPSEEDVECVGQILCERGLPVELTFRIMEFADYETKRALVVPHDPFHPVNRVGLDRYVENCWQILIGCDMMAKAVGTKIDWKRRIYDQMFSFWGNPANEDGKWFERSRRGFVAAPRFL